MAKFSNVKVGDRVFSVQFGWGIVEGFHKTIDNRELIKVKFGNKDFEYYFKDGRVNITDVNPTLFWNEVDLPTVEEDKKPFDLVGYLREKLQPTEFRVGKENFYLYFDAKNEEWYSFSSEIDIAITVYFKTCTIEIIKDLETNKVTPQQLKLAYKELGWL